MLSLLSTCAHFRQLVGLRDLEISLPDSRVFGLH